MRAIGRISALTRYPVKSMAGVPTDSASLGWHGLDGDRRFAFRRLGDPTGFPWLSASRLPSLILYQPFGVDEVDGEPLPTHVRTPSGVELALRDPELESEIASRLGSPVELMKLKHGVFDDGPVSVIAGATMAAISAEAGVDLDPRRFRANIVVETDDPAPFQEDAWLGARLVFGRAEPAPAVSVTIRDLRCMMINLHPDTAAQDARMMKTAVRLNANHAGVYATAVRAGTLRLGDPVMLLV